MDEFIYIYIIRVKNKYIPHTYEILHYIYSICRKNQSYNIIHGIYNVIIVYKHTLSDLRFHLRFENKFLLEVRFLTNASKVNIRNKSS